MMLEGMKILSFVHGLYGGSASQILADLGAEVVRVEWDMTGRIRPGSVLDGKTVCFSDDRPESEEYFLQSAVTGRH
ncbi:CoA transferase [Enterocloster sp.]|uniref:CoA transferase n=1 Tax=Enterocloster sp. TaxID=2719315 RepID=UPI0039A313E3